MHKKTCISSSLNVQLCYTAHNLFLLSNYSLICKSEERTMTHGRFICLFCKNRHRTYSYRKFLSHLNIQGIQDPFNKFPLHSCKVKAISLYFWFCFLLLFIQFHCHKKCKNGSKQNELEHKNKPSFCSLLVRKACKKKETTLAGFHDIITHSNIILLPIVCTYERLQKLCTLHNIRT